MRAKLFLLAILPWAFGACSSDEEGMNEGSEIPEVENFDREAMLTNWADNIIVPTYEAFILKSSEMEAKAQAFNESPTMDELIELRTAFIDAYIGFQTVAMFDIGAAERIDYRGFVNTYPTAVAEIETKIASNEDYNLELPSSRDEQGFPALDYLLYGLADNDDDLLVFYTTDQNASGYKEYLQRVTQRIDALSDEVLADWKDSFRNEFVANISSSATGSVDRFTNDFILYYERFLRSGKIGIPAGVFTGTVVPGTAEARYNGALSKELCQTALKAVKDFFEGKHTSGMGPSYKQYLDFLEADKEGEKLSALILHQFNSSEEKIAELDADFATQVETENTAMLSAFDELQKNVVLLKIDMMQALSISVDYVDTDGD